MINAVLETAVRSLESKSNCNCTPHPGFFVAKTGFWCQEDYYYSPDDFLTVLEQKNYQANSTEQLAIQYLQDNRSEIKLPIAALLEIVEPRDTFMKKVATVYFEVSVRL